MFVRQGLSGQGQSQAVIMIKAKVSNSPVL